MRDLISALNEETGKTFPVTVMVRALGDSAEVRDRVIAALADVIKRPVSALKNDVGRLHGGKIVRAPGSLIRVDFTFTLADPEQVAASRKRIEAATGFYTRREMGPVFWTLASIGGLVSRVEEIAGENTTDIERYGSGSTWVNL